jgi:hypothetical protein
MSIESTLPLQNVLMQEARRVCQALPSLHAENTEAGVLQNLNVGGAVSSEGCTTCCSVTKGVIGCTQRLSMDGHYV